MLEEATTPVRENGPDTSAPVLAITELQKQALMDNMQLESELRLSISERVFGVTNALSVTERARKLRAQYALQAQALRSRLEMRVNRIPPSLRKVNMQELVDKHAQQAKPLPKAPSPQKPVKAQVLSSPVYTRGAKRSR